MIYNMYHVVYQQPNPKTRFKDIQSTCLETICYDPTSINTYLCVWSGHFQIARSMACLERGILAPKQ